MRMPPSTYTRTPTQIDAKRSLPHGQHTSPKSRKVFVGGLAPETNEGTLFLSVDVVVVVVVGNAAATMLPPRPPTTPLIVVPHVCRCLEASL